MDELGVEWVLEWKGIKFTNSSSIFFGAVIPVNCENIMKNRLLAYLPGK